MLIGSDSPQVAALPRAMPVVSQLSLREGGAYSRWPWRAKNSVVCGGLARRIGVGIGGRSAGVPIMQPTLPGSANPKPALRAAFGLSVEHQAPAAGGRGRTNVADGDARHLGRPINLCQPRCAPAGGAPVFPRCASSLLRPGPRTPTEALLKNTDVAGQDFYQAGPVGPAGRGGRGRVPIHRKT